MLYPPGHNFRMGQCVVKPKISVVRSLDSPVLPCIGVLDGVLPYLPTLTLIVGAMGCCGMTMVVSLLSDTLSILTAHLYVCYLMSTTVFRHLISLIGSLWNLFRGALGDFRFPPLVVERYVLYRQTLQCFTQPIGLVGLRHRSALTRNDALHPCCLPLSNRPHLLRLLRDGMRILF